MGTLDTIIEAIQKRRPISYEYVGGKSPVYGERRGDPYAAYIFMDKDGKSTTKVDIFQLSGASSSGNYDQIKMSDLSGLKNVQILYDEPEFTINPASGYKPESDRYKSVIAKV